MSSQSIQILKQQTPQTPISNSGESLGDVDDEVRTVSASSSLKNALLPLRHHESSNSACFVLEDRAEAYDAT